MLQQTPDISTSPPYDKMRQMYSDYFSLGFINTDIKTKFALISLINYITNKAKEKKSGVTHYQIIRNILKNDFLPEDFIKGLAVVCEDFSYGCKEFPTFEVPPKEMVNTVREILLKYIPF